jgi:hypothetical protein
MLVLIELTKETLRKVTANCRKVFGAPMQQWEEQVAVSAFATSKRDFGCR